MAIRYLTTGEVVAINEAEVGPNLLADFGLLESAVLRPQQSAFGADAYPMCTPRRRRSSTPS
jgi:death-on-curing protein